MSSDSSESNENICVVCFKNVNIYSIGNCDHMVCYECSTRMRVLCRQNDCPICRQDLPRVVFTNTVKPFNEIQNCSYLEDKKFKICFQNKKIQDAFYKLLEHCCPVCPNSPTFKTFQYLYDHMRKEHDLFYCDLCVEHLKIFTSERQCYTQKNLEQHKKKGDVDDRSHRGHPLCQFCDVRYMDNDCLYRHLRRDHLFCHFCDADGHDLYYSSYDYLLEHFRTEHYLCEEGSCVDEKFTPVFRTDIDLKAHRASAHGRALGKAAAKQARTLELEFTLKPRLRHPDGSRRGRAGHNEESSSEGAVGGSSEQSSSHMNLPKLDSSDFPSLPTGPGSFVPTLLPQQRSHSGGLTIHAVGRRNTPLAINDENFPVLGVFSDSSIPGTSVKLNINQDRNSSASAKSGTSRNVSIHVNHRANGEQNIRIRQDDFPCLNSNKKTQAVPAACNWAVISSKKPQPQQQSQPNPTLKPPPRPLLDNDFPSLHSKFSTNLNLKINEPSKPNFVNVRKYKENQVDETKGKKSSSVTIPVQSEVSEASESCSNSLKSKSKKKKPKPNNTEEKSDTAKKKGIRKNMGTKTEETETCSKSQSQSALTTGDSNSETTLVKPLPKVEDWFESLKKGKEKNKNLEDQNDRESAKVSANLTKLGLNNASAAMDSSSGWSNNNNNKNNNNNNNNNNNKNKNNNNNNNSSSNSSSSSSSKSSSSISGCISSSSSSRSNSSGNSSGGGGGDSSSSSSNNNKNNNNDDDDNNNNNYNNNNNNNSNSQITGKKIFLNKTETKAPPGFDKLNGYFNNSDLRKPPPGFSLDFACSNGLTFTNSSGQSYAISTGFQYVPPVDFKNRNQNLVSKVNNLIVKATDLEQFRKMSLLFRQDLLSAKEYYEHCVKAMGDVGLTEVFPELLVLLPDIKKQQELFQVYTQSKYFSISSQNLESCVTCQQVLTKNEIKEHLTHHAMQENFPVLMADQWTN